MDPLNLQETSRWVLSHGYTLMFLAMFVEGPVVTAAGAFASALGYFNVWIVLLLSILGNLIPDIIYYALGFWGRGRLIDKYGKYFGLTKDRAVQLEGIISGHIGKALAVIKLVPLLATPGLIVAGASRVPLKKYTWWSLIITAPSSLFFLVIGYYFGATYEKIIHYLNYGGYFIAAAIIVFILISYFWKNISKRVAERIEKI